MSTEGNHAFVTGAAGKANLDKPKLLDEWRTGRDQAKLHAWGTGGHFLECTYDGSGTLTVEVQGISLPGGAAGSWHTTDESKVTIKPA